MTLQIIQTHTSAYEEMVNLRMKVLLDPIGIPRSYINPKEENNDILIGAFDDESIIGCCILTTIDSTTVQLRQMAVKKSVQGTGIGASIVIFAEEKAKDKGFRTLIMHARDAVIPFYEKLGYVIDGEGFTEVNIPHHKMKKEL